MSRPAPIFNRNLITDTFTYAIRQLWYRSVGRVARNLKEKQSGTRRLDPATNAMRAAVAASGMSLILHGGRRIADNLFPKQPKSRARAVKAPTTRKALPVPRKTKATAKK